MEFDAIDKWILGLTGIGIVATGVAIVVENKSTPAAATPSSVPPASTSAPVLPPAVTATAPDPFATLPPSPATVASVITGPYAELPSVSGNPIGKTYLASVPPGTQSPEDVFKAFWTWNNAVMALWPAGTIPSDWPSMDLDKSRIRLVIQPTQASSLATAAATYPGMTLLSTGG